MTGERSPPRAQLIPFLVLSGVVLAFAVLFFHVIRPLLLPLFVAAVVAMMIAPLQNRLTNWLRGRRRLAALLLALLVIVAIVVPIGLGAYLSAKELYRGVNALRGYVSRNELALFDPALNPRLAAARDWIETNAGLDMTELRERALEVANGLAATISQKTLDLLGDLAGFVVATFMFLVALYYFLVDGAGIVAAWEKLTPLDAEHDRIIRLEFDKVCRGVVWATVIAAIAQGVLLGLGLGVIELIFDVGIGRWVFLLSLLTILFSMVPFVGAAAIWLPTAAVLLAQGHYVAGILLAVYGATVVSMSDNLIKIMVIGDTVGLHPLLVFISVFGGINLMGLLGVFIGPMVGAVLFASLRILKLELVDFGRNGSAAGPSVTKGENEAPATS